jgi:SAM-dependent methyltransferase
VIAPAIVAISARDCATILDGLQDERMTHDTNANTAEFWEAFYQERTQVWSGKANQVLVDVAQTLAPKRALDLGSGEGGDSIWLAEHGWQVTGLDISTTALARAAAQAADRRIPDDRITWLQQDLAEWQPDAEYDLVSACFLHSPVAFPREQVLRSAPSAVTLGGVLLVVGHAAFPPWSNAQHDEHPDFPTPEQVVDSLALAPDRWRILISETRTREAVGPDGEKAHLDDSVVLIQRVA